MRQYKVTWRYYFFLFLFLGTTILGTRAVYMILNGEVTYYDEDMSRAFEIALSIPLSLVLLTYAKTTFTMIKQLFKFNKSGVTITENGIENTLVFINVLAFVMVSPVKLIPWEAVTFYIDVDGAPYIRVNVRLVKASWFAKLLLLVLGYNFGFPFVKPKVEMLDIMPYTYKFSAKNID